METYHRVCHGRSGASSPSTSSHISARSKSTAPTIYSDHRPTSKPAEPVDPNAGNGGEQRTEGEEEEIVEVELDESESEDEDENNATSPRNSASTYASTIPSEAELPEEEPRYQVFDRRPEYLPPDAYPSNPRLFADLFPSERRLLIRHDDTTLDGNMNLRVDTTVPHRAGYQQDITLFHLRMYDLFSRKFSFRRYCRESGREVCRSERKKADRRLSRSWSTALATIRPGNGTSPERKRRDSAKSRPSNDEDRRTVDDEGLDSQEGSGRSPAAFTDTTSLEFSNYAHVEVRRRIAGIPKQYEFEYWSTKFQWRRELRRDGDLREVAYHLVNMQTAKTVAHLVPDILTPMEAIEEESKGGWIPPSSMWISDPSVYEKMSDMADAIVVTGLMVLVDDCIRRHWHTGKSTQLLHPVRASFSKGIDMLGPRRLLDGVFYRRGSANL